MQTLFLHPLITSCICLTTLLFVIVMMGNVTESFTFAPELYVFLLVAGTQRQDALPVQGISGKGSLTADSSQQGWRWRPGS